jgi:hypothetical protein
MTSTLADLLTMWEISSFINYSVPNQSAGVLFDYWPIATQKEEIFEDLVYCSNWKNAPKLFAKN